MPDEIKFAQTDGSTLCIRYQGDLIAHASASLTAVVPNPHGQILVMRFRREPPVVVDDELQLADYLNGQSYQHALSTLRTVRFLRASEAHDGRGTQHVREDRDR